MTCWQEVIPEYGNPETSQNLESAEIQKRWEKVRDEVEKYETKSQILYVLDWPASNGNFYWVKRVALRKGKASSKWKLKPCVSVMP